MLAVMRAKRYPIMRIKRYRMQKHASSTNAKFLPLRCTSTYM